MKKYIILFISLLPFFCYGQIPCEELNATATSNGLNFTSVFNGQIDNWISYSVTQEILDYQTNKNNHSVTLVSEDGDFIESFISCIYWNNDVCCILFSWNGNTWSGTPTNGIELPVGIDKTYNFNRKKIIRTINLLGQEIASQKFEPFIVIYDDGTVDKRIILH